MQSPLMREEIRPGPYILVSVADSGHGMERHIREQAFEPFFTTREVGKGAGLGLAAVYGLVKQHNGYIWLHSHPGRGTVFKMYFPCFETRPREIKNRLGGSYIAAAPGSAGTILLVDEDDAMRSVAARMLANVGYNVLPAGGAAEAGEFLVRHGTRIDLLCTELFLSTMNGIELHRQLAAVQPTLEICFMSGYGRDVAEASGIPDPAVTYIQKPFSQHGIGEKIKTILRRKHGKRADDARC